MINRTRLINFFKELLYINSPSKKEKEIIAFLKKYYTDLGFECFEDNAAEMTGGEANNLYGILKGDRKYKSVCFNAHCDTVLPTEGIKIIEEENIIKTDGKTILGADDKAGIAIITEAVRSIIDSKVPHGDIYVLFTVQEEIGTGGANCVQTDRLHPDLCISFDTGVPVVSLVSSAPTHWTMKYTASSDTANPIIPIAESIANLRTGIIDEESCCNFGKISANAESLCQLPKSATLIAEARSRNNKKAKKLQEMITETIEKTCAKYNTELKKDLTCQYEAFNIDETDTDFLFAKETAENMGIKPVIEHSLGGYDASIFNAKGLKTIVSGTGYENVHTTEEFIYIDQFETACKYAYSLIKNFR